MDNDFDYKAAMSEFIDDSAVWKQIVQHMKTELLPDKKNWCGFVFSVVLGLILAIVVGTVENTVSLAQQICGIFFDAQISIFECNFAVYSILLAFLSDSYIKKLLKVDYDQGSSYLKRSIRYYEAALLIYFVGIMYSLLVKVVLTCMPENFLLTTNMIVNETLATILLCFYFCFSIRVLFELKSIIGNTLLLFRSSIVYKIQSFSEEDSKKVERWKS